MSSSTSRSLRGLALVLGFGFLMARSMMQDHVSALSSFIVSIEILVGYSTFRSFAMKSAAILAVIRSGCVSVASWMAALFTLGWAWSGGY